MNRTGQKQKSAPTINYFLQPVCIGQKKDKKNFISVNFNKVTMTNAWIKHCKKYQKKHNCSYKEAMKKSKKTYKPQSGGNITGNIIRGSVAGIRKGFKTVPFGDKVLKVVNPVLETGLRDVDRWERKERPIDRWSQEENEAEYAKWKNKQKKKRDPKGKKKKK